MVNETFVKKLGLSPDEAINKRMQIWGRRAPIVGVVKDFHVSTLSAAIEPVALFNDIENYSTLGVRVNAANAEMAHAETLAAQVVDCTADGSPPSGWSSTTNTNKNKTVTIVEEEKKSNSNLKITVLNTT